MNNMNEPGYESLAQVLQEAYDQAARGKGAERHANDLPFDQQPMQQPRSGCARLRSTHPGKGTTSAAPSRVPHRASSPAKARVRRWNP